MVLGYFIGISSPYVSLTKISLPSNLVSSLAFGDDHRRPSIERFFPEHLVTPQDLIKKPKYLVTFTVGLNQKDNIDAAVKKRTFKFCFSIMMVEQVSGMSLSGPSVQFISVLGSRPNVAAYDYIFIWDEDLGVENFNAEKYIRLVKRHGLEISQPGLEPNSGLTWQMTKRRDDREVHKNTDEKPGWCSNPRLPPCAAFVEIMAPVFSREAWRCVWHMIQNDLVHGWGLDFALRRCVEPAHEKIGVVDSQWIVHQFVPSLGSQVSQCITLLAQPISYSVCDFFSQRSVP
ncbi:hypothetical protein KY290_029957 [Solanum tuberosum]|uniref:Uncharacterized protein n=1 Tax=Solanum tuberosum TaxID=4113 RepID=A0ABQ7UM81_SOLTU|nr:hypothetical protein KY290_029957 [Solanum tuberosum]